jgi:predicted RecB family nuclease
MQEIGGVLVLSPSDLSGFLACPHLTQLERQVAAGLLARPLIDDPDGDVRARRGDEHEQAELARLRALHRGVVEIPRPDSSTQALRAAEAATLAAMAAGAPVIYQASFFDGRWRGHADFLLRVETPTVLGPWGYEVADTKLAHRARPEALLQLCAYSEQVARLQGVWPEEMAVVTGDGERHRYRVADAAAYWRSARARLEAVVDGGLAATYPERIGHCDLCSWAEVCDARRRADDHLSLVAGMRRSAITALGRVGVTTAAALAVRPLGAPVRGMGQASADRMREQARLQLRQRADGRVRYELLLPDRDLDTGSDDEADEADEADEGDEADAHDGVAVAEARGLALLPPPSPGDLFFDIEGDPWVGDAGLEYLWGVVSTPAGGPPSYRALWAHTPAQERGAFEAFVDLVMAGLDADPDLHVYHYAPYEATALKKLMGRHGTREAEVDRLLRGKVLVDLYRVVRQGVRVSQEGYGLKKLEPLYLGPRQGGITDGGSSIAAYEGWLESGDQGVLDALADYNELDCRSTLCLRDWLEDRRAELVTFTGADPGRPPPADGLAPEAQAQTEAHTAALAARLVAGLPDDGEERTAEQQARWLLAQLLDWHRRESRPEWWAWYDRRGRSEDELADDADSLAPLTYVGEAGRVKRSVVHRYGFPPQEHKMAVGDKPLDPATEKPAGEVMAVDSVAGTIDLKRGLTSNAPHPRALVPAKPVDTAVLRDGVARVAEHVLGTSDGSAPSGPYRAALDLLARRPPACAGHPPGAPLAAGGEAGADAVRRLVPTLAGGWLAVQGPPGSGKTSAGAAVIVDAVRRGARVGVTGPSHRAIANLLSAACARAGDEGVALSAVQRTNDQADVVRSPCVVWADSPGSVADALAAGGVDVVAGTAWHFARQDIAGALDLLVVDEAGQVSLANVVAMSGAAPDLVLLGDPQQLAQPTKGVHPCGAEVSALGHVMAGAATVAADRGVFLDRSYRMHPEVCRFVSDVAYDGRLEADPACARQRVDHGPVVAGSGLRWLRVASEGNRTASGEEAVAVAAVVHALVGRPYTDHRGGRRLLTLDDVLVISPYNAQVARLAAALPPGARVGTVDRFQGQEAPVVVYSMAASSAEEVPRGVEFLFSLNRLNVAVSRARAMAVLVCSPALLQARCSSPDQLRLVNALCRFTELARQGAERSELALS